MPEAVHHNQNTTCNLPCQGRPRPVKKQTNNTQTQNQGPSAPPRLWESELLLTMRTPRVVTTPGTHAQPVPSPRATPTPKTARHNPNQNHQQQGRRKSQQHITTATQPKHCTLPRSMLLELALDDMMTPAQLQPVLRWIRECKLLLAPGHSPDNHNNNSQTDQMVRKTKAFN